MPGHLPYIPHGRGQRAGELTAGETRNACFSAAVVAEWACEPARSARHSRKLRLIRSGEPSRISLRKRRISPPLKASPECPLRDMRQASRLALRGCTAAWTVSAATKLLEVPVPEIVQLGGLFLWQDC